MRTKRTSKILALRKAVRAFKSKGRSWKDFTKGKQYAV